MELFYLPPLSEFRKLIGKDEIIFPIHQPFRKMSFHNRAIIPSANGLINLTVPVKGGREVKGPLIEIKIDNSQDWQIRQWRTITSAYGRSPWFEFYEPLLRPFYEKEYELLWEWNADLLLWSTKMMGLKITPQFKPEPSEVDRLVIKSSTYKDESFLEGLNPYTQVFQDRIGFHPNVSIIDLLFNEGKQGIRLIHS